MELPWIITLTFTGSDNYNSANISNENISILSHEFLRLEVTPNQISLLITKVTIY